MKPAPVAAAGFMMLLVACASPPVVPDFSTPLATLKTFQAAFNADEPGVEYECFALQFKERRGGFDLDQYTLMRAHAMDQNPLLGALMATKDLSGSVTGVQRSPDNTAASMTLSVLGRELEILFLREPIYRMEFEEDPHPRENAFAGFPEAVRRSAASLTIEFPDVPAAWLSRLPKLRRIAAEVQWKFGDIVLLEGDEGGAPPEL